jgi:hypothetical protein
MVPQLCRLFNVYITDKFMISPLIGYRCLSAYASVSRKSVIRVFHEWYENYLMIPSTRTSSEAQNPIKTWIFHFFYLTRNILPL